MIQTQLPSHLKSLIIIGASGVGKGTIIKSLQQKHPGLFQLVLSYTTRQIRPKQKHGVDYFYISKQQFSKKIPQMLQHKLVHRNWYGTSKQHLQYILNLNKIPILDIDVQGMLQIRQKIECQVLCIMPASWELLRQRLQGRKTESIQVINSRMQENVRQVQRMLSLNKKSNISFVTNYQYQLTTYGIEKWLATRFQRFREREAEQIKNKRLLLL